MSSPVSVGDVITILGTVYDAYATYRNLPGDLQEILDKLEDTKDELESLNQILRHSRRKKYRQYPGTEDLLLDINDAKTYLSKYQPLIDNGSVRMRVKTTFQARWNQGEIQRHARKMDKHMQQMRDFKHTVEVQALFDNTEIALGTASLVMRAAGLTTDALHHPQTSDDSSTITADDADTIHRAQRTLKLYKAIDTNLTSIIEASPQSTATDELRVIQRFKGDVADIIEKKGLYKMKPLPTDKLKYLDQIAHLSDNMRLREEESNTEVLTPLASPLAVGNISDVEQDGQRAASIYTPNATPGEDTASISESWIQALKLDDRSSMHRGSNGFHLTDPVLELHESEIVESDSDSSDQRDMLDNQFILQRPITLITPWSGQKFVCTLSIRQSEGSLQVEARTVKRYNQHEMPTLGNHNAAAPATVLALSAKTAEAVHASDGTQLVFNHALLGGLGSFPRVLHPKAEENMQRPDTYPFGIEFYTHQYLKVAGYDKLPRAVKGLGYLFQSKEDRDIVREKMFGRKLLASVGISTIQYDKKSRSRPCGTQPITLWKRQQQDDDGEEVLTVHKDGLGTDLSITVQCNSKGKHTDPDSVMEFAVLAAKGIEKVRAAEGKELELKLVALTGSDPISPGSPAAGDTLSSDVSVISHGSDYSQSIASTSPGSRRSSLLSRMRTGSVSSVNTMKPETSFHCFIKFTESSEEYTRQKKRFLDALKKNLSPT